MQLPWRSDEGQGGGSTTAEREAHVAPTRTRRWRRIVARPAVVADPAASAPAAETPNEAAAPREPGFVAVALARILIAIDFALGGRR